MTTAAARDLDDETPARRPGRLRIQRSGFIGELVIDNPGRRNAVSQDMWRQFIPLLRELKDDPSVRTVLIRGAEGNFSAGADISQLESILHNPASGLIDGGDVTVAEEAIASFPKPTIAVIEGYCIGGGWEIAGACDFRIAASTASIGITPARIGILYPFSGIRRLVTLVGPAAAKYLLLTGNLLPVQEALSAGLLTRIVPPHELHSEALALAEELASRSQFSIQAHKDLVDSLADGATDFQAKCAYWQHQLGQSPDAAIGAKAFLAKERPEFEWREPSEPYPLHRRT